MKHARIISLGIIVGIATSAAATVPLDRPTPPPCCADGVCHAHPGTFGYFQTRWRVWPGVSIAPMPTVKQPIVREIPGIEKIEIPTPEEEDRQAPPPTKSPTTQSPIEVAPGTVPTTTPLESLELRDPGAGPTTPATPPTATPGGPQPATPRVTYPPFGSEPSGGTDRPPMPPFSPSASRSRTPINVQPAAQSAAGWSTARTPVIPASRPSGQTQQRGANDPPPPPPFALGSATL